MGFKKGSKILKKFDFEESAIEYQDSQNQYYIFNGLPSIASIVRREHLVYSMVEREKVPQSEYLVITTPKNSTSSKVHR